MKQTRASGTAWQPERPYVPLPLRLLRSPAWQAASVHTKRLIEFLMIEWASHAGHENGLLLAPRKQLSAFGIRTHAISSAIAEAEKLGLIDVIRGKGRAPSRYALTWLPVKGSTEPSNRWHHYQPTDRCEVGSFFNECQMALSEQCQMALTRPVASAK